MILSCLLLTLLYPIEYSKAFFLAYFENRLACFPIFHILLVPLHYQYIKRL